MISLDINTQLGKIMLILWNRGPCLKGIIAIDNNKLKNQ
jgi:hypothetical protein